MISYTNFNVSIVNYRYNTLFATAMSELLTSSVAVVTGASSGNGRSIARTMAEHGADVIVADIRKEPRQADRPTHELITEETASRANFVECDVTDVEDLEAAMEAASEFGSLDIMVNNAGIVEFTEFTKVTEEQYNRIMNINVKGTFFGCQLAAERMRETGGGSIINLSSVDGLFGDGDVATYCASKGAVRLLTYAVADALGSDGIRVNAIHPGLIETAMTMTDSEGHRVSDLNKRVKDQPIQRPGRPQDIADAALYLASDLSEYVTGESLVVDGGAAHT